MEGYMYEKRKLTLSIRRDILEEVKKYAINEGKNLSSIVEEYFEYFVLEKWINDLAIELNLGELTPTSELEIPLNRPKGLDSAKIVREIRDERLANI
jgi:hypothetical protein